MDLICLKEEYLGGLQLAENITDLTFNWERGLPLKEVLPELVRWRQLRRLAFTDLPKYGSDPTFEGLEFFLMMMKNLSYLHIVPDRRDEGQLKILRDKVKKFILPQRPNFMFDISDD